MAAGSVERLAKEAARLARRDAFLDISDRAAARVIKKLEAAAQLLREAHAALPTGGKGQSDT